MQIQDPPKFPPRPIDDSRTPSLILSALPAELPPSLRPKPEPEPEPTPSGRRRLALLVAGALVLVALIGVGAWAVFGGSDPEPVAAPAPTGPEFTRATEPGVAILDSDCADHAYGATKRFLLGTRCQQLTRVLFTSTLEDGRTVYTSVAVVRMPSSADAQALYDLIRQDNTGSVLDLVRERQATIPGLERLSRGGFASTVNGAEVTIAESDTVKPDSDLVAHKAEMKRVSTEALRLGHDLH